MVSWCCCRVSLYQHPHRRKSTGLAWPLLLAHCTCRFARSAKPGQNQKHEPTSIATLPSFIHRRIHLHRHNCMPIGFTGFALVVVFAYGTRVCWLVGIVICIRALPLFLNLLIAICIRALPPLIVICIRALPLLIVICIRALPLVTSVIWIRALPCRHDRHLRKDGHLTLPLLS